MSANKLVLGLDIFCFSIQPIITPTHNNMNEKNKKKGTSIIFSISSFCKRTVGWRRKNRGIEYYYDAKICTLQTDSDTK